MSKLTAALIIVLAVLVTSITEFTIPDIQIILAPLIIIGISVYFWKHGKTRWLFYAALVIGFFPETQSQIMGPLEIHHALLLASAIIWGLPWLVIRPEPLPRLSRALIAYYGLIIFITVTQFAQIDSWHRALILGFMFLITILLPQFVKTTSHFKELFAILLFSAIISSLWGLGAFYYGTITESLFTNPYIHISIVEGVPRLAGTLLDSNFLGHFLLLVVPGLTALLITRWQALSRKAKTGLLASDIFLLSIFFLTYSRSSYLGIAAALAILLIIYRRTLASKAIALVFAGIILATLFSPAFPFYSVYRTPSRILPTKTKEVLMLGFDPTELVDNYKRKLREDPTITDEELSSILARDVSSDSLGYRIEFWKAGLSMFTNNPIKGVGVGQFRYRFTEYGNLPFLREPDAHNIFIEQLAETGVLGFATLIFVLVYSLYLLSRAIRKNTGVQRLIPASILATLIGLLVQSVLLGGFGATSIFIALGAASVYSSKALLIKKPQHAKKKIVYITATTEKDGPGNVLALLIRNLDRDKYQPILITILRGGEWDTFYKDKGVKRINFHLIKPLDLIAPFLLWPLLYYLNPDLVHTQMLRGDVYGRWASARLAIPFISTIHNMDIWKRTQKPFHRFATWFDKQGLIQARHLTTVSRAVEKDLIKYQQIPTSLVTVIPNAIDIKKYALQLSDTDTNNKKHELGIEPDDLLIGTVARAHHQKAPEIFLAAARETLKKHQNVTFMWVGGGPLLDVLSQAVKDLDLENKVKITGPRKDVPELLNVMDIFVLASRFEGMPMTVLEALASGTASIVSNVSGNPEIVTDHENGLLVPADDPKALAKAFDDLINDQKLRQRLANAGREYVPENHDPESMAQKYQKIYETVT